VRKQLQNTAGVWLSRRRQSFYLLRNKHDIFGTIISSSGVRAGLYFSVVKFQAISRDLPASRKDRGVRIFATVPSETERPRLLRWEMRIVEKMVYRHGPLFPADGVTICCLSQSCDYCSSPFQESKAVLIDLFQNIPHSCAASGGHDFPPFVAISLCYNPNVT